MNAAWSERKPALNRVFLALFVAVIATLLGAQAALADSTPNRGNEINYADNWAQSYNTYYPQLPEDCTNFASQALYAGGRQFLGYDQTYVDDHNWWYDPNHVVATSSQSWSVASRLLNNMSLNDSNFRSLGSWYGIQTGDPRTTGGDLIYYQWGGGGDHLSVQVGWGYDQVHGWWGAYVDAHTNPRFRVYWTLAQDNVTWPTTTITSYHIDSGRWGDVAIYGAANGQFTSTEMGYTGGDQYMLRARSSDWGEWEQYAAEAQPDGSWAFRSLADNLYVSTELGYGGSSYAELRARAYSVGAWEKFNLIDLGNMEYAIQSQANGLYVSEELGYTGNYYGMLRARSSQIGPWEQFYIWTV